MSLSLLFILFLIYSVAGWIIEIIVVSFQKHKWVARGFLIGPYCPIYGIGATLIVWLLGKYYNDIVVLFFLSCILGASLEYFTSYIMEIIFKTRWWDYGHRKYNINGRISLETTIFFGLLGVLLVRFISPFLIYYLLFIDPVKLNFISLLLAILFFTDVIVSFNIISNIRRVDLSDAKDTTEEITAKVKSVLKQRSLLNKRLINAFPNLQVFRKNLKKLEEFRDKSFHKNV